MKVLHIITSLGMGGAEKLLVNTANEQIKDDDVRIIYFKKDSLRDQIDPRIEVINLPLNWNIVSKLKKEIRNFSPDVIHTHLPHADLFTSLATFGKNESKKITTIHSITFRNNSFLNELYIFLYRGIFNWISPKSKVIAISKVVKDLLTSKMKVPTDRIVIIPNAIPDHRYERHENITKGNLINIVYLGRLEAVKNPKLLLEAIHLLPSKIKNRISAQIIGDGSELEELQKLVSKFGLTDNIEFLGVQKDIYPFLHNAEIMIVPSLNEGFGLVYLEAFQSSTALIASDIDAAKELIDNYENGLLFPSGNCKELSNKIVLLVENSQLRNELIKNAKQKYKNNFQFSKYLDSLRKYYND